MGVALSRFRFVVKPRPKVKVEKEEEETETIPTSVPSYYVLSLHLSTTTPPRRLRASSKSSMPPPWCIEAYDACRVEWCSAILYVVEGGVNVKEVHRIDTHVARDSFGPVGTALMSILPSPSHLVHTIIGPIGTGDAICVLQSEFNRLLRFREALYWEDIKVVEEDMEAFETTFQEEIRQVEPLHLTRAVARLYFIHRDTPIFLDSAPLEGPDDLPGPLNRIDPEVRLGIVSDEAGSAREPGILHIV